MENKQVMSPEEARERFKQAVLAKFPFLKAKFDAIDAKREGK